MPAVLSELEGLKRARLRDEQETTADGKTMTVQVFDHFEQIAPGRMSAAQYDAFVHDTVNFLDYVGEPTQADRRALRYHRWVVLVFCSYLRGLLGFSSSSSTGKTCTDRVGSADTCRADVPSMTLFSAPTDPWSHRTRIVLAEKGISIEIVSVEPGAFPRICWT